MQMQTQMQIMLVQAAHHKFLRDGWAHVDVGSRRHHSIAVQPEGRPLGAGQHRLAALRHLGVSAATMQLTWACTPVRRP